jgi:4-amino-4-deoxy-L-arabinose transferase-like glycosyltransferase
MVPARTSEGEIRRAAIISATIALVIRLCVSVATGALWHPQVWEYDSIARAMLAGQGFVYVHTDVLYRSYAPPLHSWLAAASYWVSGGLVPLMLLQVVAGAALAAVTASLAGQVFRRALAALAAGLLVAVHPGLVIYSATKSHPLVFDALFFSLALLLTFRLAAVPSPRRAAELGLLIGLGALSRATIVIFLPVAGFWLLARAPARAWLPPIRAGLIAGLCAAAVIAPWTIRNSLIHHRFVFMLTTDGEDFWRGNNPWASGHSYADSGSTVMAAIPPAVLQDIRTQPGELAQADWYWAHARAFIEAQPVAFVRLTLRKFWQFWWFAPSSGVLYPRSWMLAYMTFYLACVACALLGLRALPRTRAARQQALVIGAFLIALSALQSLYYVEGRHRWGVEPMLLILSGGGAASLVDRRRRDAAS